MKRKPYVAGSFYPGQKDLLEGMIEGFVDRNAERTQVLAVVVPHAGYEYSGPVAGAVFSSVELPAEVVILGPSHRGIEPLFAIQKQGSWLTPLGESPIAAELADLIMKSCPLVADDERAQLHEHSLEVELPFLQYFRKDVSLVPICVSHLAGYAELASLGRGIAEAIRTSGRPVLVVASTDMSHYVSQETAERKDKAAIRRILDLDPEGLFETVRKLGITMCGFQPTAAALVAAKSLGATGAHLVKYETSGSRTGDFTQVVGYAGIRIF